MSSEAKGTALITGGGSSRGIGRAAARRLGSDGFTVAVLDIDEAAAAATAEIVRDETGAVAFSGRIDVTNPASVTDAVAAVEAALEPVTVLANIAGISAPTPFELISFDEWNRLFAVNVTGTFLVTQAVVPGMRERRYGRIINMSSVSGQRGGGVFGATHYSATKSAILGMTKSLAREVGRDNITVNSVAPGMVDTDITNGALTEDRKVELASGTLVGRMAETCDVAGAIAYLASPDAAFITGATIDVNGGYHLH